MYVDLNHETSRMILLIKLMTSLLDRDSIADREKEKETEV